MCPQMFVLTRSTHGQERNCVQFRTIFSMDRKGFVYNSEPFSVCTYMCTAHTVLSASRVKVLKTLSVCHKHPCMYVAALCSTWIVVEFWHNISLDYLLLRKYLPAAIWLASNLWSVCYTHILHTYVCTCITLARLIAIYVCMWANLLCLVRKWYKSGVKKLHINSVHKIDILEGSYTHVHCLCVITHTMY